MTTATPTLCRPTHAKRDERGRGVTLFFPAGSLAPSGHYWVVGGITWPVRGASGEFAGYALVLAQHIETGCCYVLDEHSFATVDPVIDRQGALVSRSDDGFEPYPYLAVWLGLTWPTFNCQHWYYHQDLVLHQQYARQVRQAAAAARNPTFVEADWKSQEQVIAEVYRLDASGKLSYRYDGPLHRALVDAEAAPDEFLQPVHALQCALVGISRRPPWITTLEVPPW